MHIFANWVALTLPNANDKIIHCLTNIRASMYIVQIVKARELCMDGHSMQGYLSVYREVTHQLRFSVLYFANVLKVIKWEEKCADVCRQLIIVQESANTLARAKVWIYL